ncbi:MAG: cation:proton antiporter [Planctomycetes bacterium]|nr:cation:proton antiporter [Planctomycetota bacterium]
MILLSAGDMARFQTLQEIGVLMAVGVVAALVMARLKLPAVAGMLVAGAICGPYGMRLVSDPESISLLAEIGVVLLLFTIGLEFPLSRFLRIGKPLLIGGTLQVSLTVVAALGVGLACGLPFRAALPVAFAVSLSSTAVVLRGLQDRGEVDAPHGRFIVGTLIFQDLCVIPMLLALPVLAGAGDALTLAKNIGLALGQAALAVVATYLVAKMVLPVLLRRVDATRSREIFILAILTVCIGIAFATEYAGLSMALGAFLAGIVLAESPYANRALSDVLPLRDVLNALFFISLGMLFDWRTLLDAPLIVLGIFAGLVIGKGLLATIAAMFMRFPARAAIVAGLGLAQFGEFGIVIMKTAGALDLMSLGQEGRWISAAAVLSMFVTPLVLRFSPHLAAGARLLRPLERLLGVRGVDSPARDLEEASHHVVVAGYGVGGRAVVSALKAVGVRYVVLDMNAETVRAARLQKEPVYYADVTSEEALHHARVRHAAAFVLTINDPGAAHRTLDAVHRYAPETPIVVRTHYLGAGDQMRKQGATEVVSEELEAAVEIMARVLRMLNVPRNVIDREVALVRDNTQGSARSSTLPRPKLPDLQELADLKVESVLVSATCFSRGKTLLDLNLRARTGASVIALRRDGLLASQPRPDDPLAEGDILYLVGSLEDIRNAMTYLESGSIPEPMSERIEPVV